MPSRKPLPPGLPLIPLVPPPLHCMHSSGCEAPRTHRAAHSFSLWTSPCFGRWQAEPAPLPQYASYEGAEYCERHAQEIAAHRNLQDQTTGRHHEAPDATALSS